MAAAPTAQACPDAKWCRAPTPSYDHGRHYRYDGHHFYRQAHGVWIKVIESPRGFDYGIFR
ncbi:hypothetical protein ACWEQ1_12150 [Streptomyces nodosus]